MNNPIITLAEFASKKWGRNIETRVVGKEGADHNPTITVEIDLPNGRTYTASGRNKKEAKQKAATKALKQLNQ